MNIHYNIKQYTIALLFAIAGTACTSDEEQAYNPIGGGELVTVEATIGETDTKASIAGADDPLSYRKFEKNDKVGFYATNGITAVNKELTLGDNNQFINDALHWNEGQGYAEKLFSYYPYNEAAATDKAGTSIFKTVKTPIDAGYDQIEDFLIAQLPSAVAGVPISFSYKHAFSMLIIMRGKGFELPAGNKTPRTVTVTMSEAVNGVKVVNGDHSLELVSNLSTPAATNTFTATESTYDGKAAWFVIVPAGKLNGTDITVESITLNRSDGTQETIKPGTPITPASNYKYPLTAELKDANAIIYPHEIRMWTDVEIDLKLPVGIYDEAALYEWYTNYNTSTSGNEKILKKYGRKIGTHWTFYIRKNLSMSELEKQTSFTPIAKVVETLSDTLDCCGFSFDGLKLDNTNDTPTGFIGTITSTGVLKNLILKDAEVTSTYSDVGILAGKNKGGKIINSKVTGTSFATGINYVGGLVGNHANGSMKDCKSAAFVTGTGTNVGKLIGGGSGTLDNCTSSGTVIK